MPSKGDKYGQHRRHMAKLMQEFLDSDNLFTTSYADALSVRPLQKIVNEYGFPIEIVFHKKVYWIRTDT